MGFDHVHDIVAELFLEEFAVIVNLVFEVERTVHINLRNIVQDANHMRHGAIAQLHDMLDVLQLFLGKIFLKMELAVDGASHVVASIADTFVLFDAGEQLYKVLWSYAMPATKNSQRFYLHFTWILL